MAPEQLSAYKHSLVLSVQTPYMIIVSVVLLVALLIMLTKFPALQILVPDSQLFLRKGITDR